jgi:hypothetical protein
VRPLPVRSPSRALSGFTAGYGSTLALQATWSRSRSARCCGAAQPTAPIRRARSAQVRPLLPHLRGSTATSAPGTGLAPATSALGLGCTLPHRHPDWGCSCPHLHGDWAHPSRLHRGLGPIATQPAGRGACWCRDGACSADPCEYIMDGTCDVPRFCSVGDFRDCGMTVPGLNATLPDAIGSLVCRSKITRMYCSALPDLRVTPP